MRRGETRERLLRVLNSFQRDYGRMPTWKELVAVMGANSQQSLRRHIGRLHAEGRIVILPRGTIPIALTGEGP